MSAVSSFQSTTAIDVLDPDWEDKVLSSRVRRFFWFFGVAFSFIAAITSRFAMNVDGISYLDLGNAYLNHDWNAATNAYWSPSYAWLLAAALRLCHASLYWESTIAHGLNFIIFLASMAAFEIFLSELCHRDSIFAEQQIEPAPVWAVRILGYSLFLYAGLVWISVGILTPDQCVATIMYLVAAVMLRLVRGNPGWRWYAVLGILLGVGYLTKAALFPLGLVSLLSTPFLGRRAGLDIGARLSRGLLAACLFILVASPLVIALSRAKMRFTFGDVGKLAYAGFVNGVPGAESWQGQGHSGTPKHPVRKLAADPSVYEFASPVGGTYPPWYDASYWLDGVKVRVDFRGQLRALASSIRAYVSCLEEQAGFIVVLVGLFTLDSKKYRFWRELTATWPSWIAAIAGLGLFSLVLVETRYVASFLVIAAVSFLGAIRLVPTLRTRRLLMGLSATVAAFSLISVAAFITPNLYSSLFRPRNVQWEVAQALGPYGIRPGDGLATIVDHRLGDYWAHLAHVKIIEDIPFGDMAKLASLTSESRARLIRTLQKPGAKGLITTPAPPPGTGFRWIRLGNTDYFIFPLDQEAQP